MKRVIFSLYVEIPDDRIDHPGSWNNETGEQYKTDKSIRTKEKFNLYKPRLIKKQQEYAQEIGVDYIHYDDIDKYNTFAEWFRISAPQISEYDIINFYKHSLMFELAFRYDEVCYFDLDVVPNIITHPAENIFDSLDMNYFWCGSSTDESMWGRRVELKYYNVCIRNPASKYYNAKALAEDCNLTPDENVYNTGIMVASSQKIKQLDYFANFTYTIYHMQTIKEDEDSMYPWPIRRSFGYDNETCFSHRANLQEVCVKPLSDLWHCTSFKNNPLACLYHVISKDFEYYL